MDSESEVDQVVRDRLRAYVRRAHLLRQIHSNKGARAHRWSQRYLIATVLVASVVSVIGFMGTDRLARSTPASWNVSVGAVENMYSLAVLSILVITILGLVYRFDERGSRHYRSIEILTDFIRDVEDAVALSSAGIARLSSEDLQVARTRYKGLLSSLPPSTDREYLEAKKSAAEKREKARRAAGGEGGYGGLWEDATSSASVERDLGSKLAELLFEPTRKAVLVAVRDSLGDTAWVTGGFVREAVWDRVHEYTIPTPSEDVDIIYFDAEHVSEQNERQKEGQLAEASANIHWSVKNQGRMHSISGGEPYRSLEDAVKRFPETATAVACRIDKTGQIKILAPYGLADLFDLVVRPTPGFDVSRYRARIAKKAWGTKWPQLCIVDGGLIPSPGFATQLPPEVPGPGPAQ